MRVTVGSLLDCFSIELLSTGSNTGRATLLSSVDEVEGGKTANVFVGRKGVGELPTPTNDELLKICAYFPSMYVPMTFVS